MDNLCFYCTDCQYRADNFSTLRRHRSKRHGVSSVDTYVQYRCVGVRPTCECGCGQYTRYRGETLGFMRFVRGHHVVVNNPWGHNEKAKKKSLNTRRQMLSEGTLKPWNTGLTISDQRVARYGRKISDTIRSRSGECERRSKRMRQNRLNGTIPTLYGKEHSQWRGGTSQIGPLTRARLYSRWVAPKLRSADFTCHDCGKQRDLCVHHDGERFAMILQKAIQTLGEPGDDFDKRSEIAEWVTQYHLENNVSGVVLCCACHEVRHEND